ncbi:MAG: FUN14 domain-containing protein [Candidatus Aminicenantes bacterium]|nr:FUN14 domain-containing protein [Candidatus Aminicenantes bacterium]
MVGWFSFKKAFKVLAIISALVFIALQFFISQGYIEGIEWTKIGSEFKNTFDKGFFTGIWHFITRNIPFGGSFVVGFLIRLKKG